MNSAAVKARLVPLSRVLRGRTITSNLVARLGAIAALSVSSLLVARTGGAAAVGTMALLRVLPWFTGLLLSCGLYGAAPYFLSGPGRTESGYRLTLPAMAIAAGVVGAALWVLAAPVVGPRFLPELSRPLMLAAGIAVPTQLLETTAKTCSQGFDDLTGSNRIIVFEELLFVPIYGILAAAGASPYLAMIVALPLGDVFNGGSGWIRLWRRGYFRDVARPSLKLARDIAAYGTRAELNSITLLLNGRLDFIIVAYLVGPAALGIYAVASRMAELVRLPSLAINYVLYPTYARPRRCGGCGPGALGDPPNVVGTCRPRRAVGLGGAGGPPAGVRPRVSCRRRPHPDPARGAGGRQRLRRAVGVPVRHRPARSDLHRSGIWPGGDRGARPHADPTSRNRRRVHRVHVLVPHHHLRADRLLPHNRGGIGRTTRDRAGTPEREANQQAEHLALLALSLRAQELRPTAGAAEYGRCRRPPPNLSRRPTHPPEQRRRTPQ